MPDREKVIKGLELCTIISQNGCLMLCPYKDEKDETYSGFCEQVLKHDALALIREQEWQIKNRDESIEKAREEIKWLRGMLKEQEQRINFLEERLRLLEYGDQDILQSGLMPAT